MAGPYRPQSPALSGTPGTLKRRCTKSAEEPNFDADSQPQHWKVVEHVRGELSGRTRDRVTESSAPSHPIAYQQAGGTVSHLPSACPRI